MANPLFFRQAVDTQFPSGPQGHLMDLSGAWSLGLSSSLESTDRQGQAFSAHAVLPLSSNPSNLLHGYYLSPAYIYTEGLETGRLNYLGFKGWHLAAGRGNLNFPGSVFRGFLQIAYRELSLNDDSSTRNLTNNFSLRSGDEKKKSILISTGVSSTQKSLVSQRRPFLDSELLLTVRYDYEEGDFFSHAQAALFYPTWIELGASLGWFKVFRQDKNTLYDEVGDDITFGPRIRGRAWEHFAYDFTLQWHAYHDFASSFVVPPPRAMISAIVNF